MAGIIALLLPARGPYWSALTWETLLASENPLAGGFRIDQFKRGTANNVLVSVAAPDGASAAEIHILPRGCWPGVRNTTSFGVAYEAERSLAPERLEIREAIADRIGALDRGLPPPDAIPLRSGFEPGVLLATLQGWSSLLLPTCLALLLALPFIRSPAVLACASIVGASAVVARLSGLLFASEAICPPSPIVNLDLNVRAVQALWLALIVTSPVLCWRAGAATGVGSRRLLLAVGAAALCSAAAVWQRGDEPLHANAHAWREAREVLIPWGNGRETGAGTELYLHGKAAPALEWLIASAEYAVTGRVHPFAISRVAGVAAAAACALLVAVIVGSAGAGFAAGATLAFLPLAELYAVSGSPLAVAAWLLPWSLGLLVAAARSGDPMLIAGTALAGVLGAQSHTAMLGLLPVLVLGWLILAAPPIRRSGFALAAFVCLATAGLIEFVNTYRMLAFRNDAIPIGLFGSARLGLEHRNLFLDPHWLSPMLLPLALFGLVVGAARHGVRQLAVPLLALLFTAAPFFAANQCSSDAVRYQGTLLGLIICLAAIGIWDVTAVVSSDTRIQTGLCLAMLGGLIVFPSTLRVPIDPAVIEHRLVEEAVSRMQPGTLVVLPRPTVVGVVYEFPDFLLPPQSSVVFEGDPKIGAHQGPLLLYLGLACISLDGGSRDVQKDMRGECRQLRERATPWLVRTIENDALPRLPDGTVWTYHRLATGVPFGFFKPT